MIFERIVCGVDGSAPGLEALRQATLLRSDPARLLAVTVCETHGSGDRATVARDAARRHIGGVPLAEARIVAGAPVPSLLAALDAESATLLAVGTHGDGHLAEMLLGSVATSMLQQAPCSVLVARGSDDAAWSPHSIVVGMDGSR